LADHSKIRRAAVGKDGKPETEELHKVQILDPAAGTGTFLAEVIDKIFSYFAKNKGAWNDYCEKHLIPRINGFEILMASYAMAHFKLDMKLQETSYTFTDNSRLRVYLTNSLEEPENVAEKFPLIEWLTQEANEASKIKRDTPMMVVLGNPPYSGESANATVDAFLAAYKKEPGGIGKLKEKNPKWLNDDYVKFIRYGQSFIEKYGEGILAYINNHSFLDNPTFRGMRWHLLKTFDKIYILDLHGNAKRKETAPDGGKDENVFDIQVGASINIFIKTGKKNNDALAQVFHYDLYGKRDVKYNFLIEHTLSSIAWKKLLPEEPHYFFVEKNFGNKAEYENGFGVQELFPASSVGIATARDDFTIHETAQQVKNTLTQFLSMDDESARKHFNLGKDAQDWSVAGARKDIVPNPKENPDPDFSKIIKINYRPFDIRWTYYTGNSNGFHCRPRENIMRHFLNGENIDNYGLVTVRRQPLAMPVSYYFISNLPISNGIIRSDSVSIDTFFPLYLYPDANSLDTSEKRRPNLNMEIVNAIAQKINLSFTTEQTGNENTFAPIDILDYMYAVLYSNNYRKKYAEFLKIDFPRIPYPQNAEHFQKLAALGSLLRNLHLMKDASPVLDLADFPIPGTNEIEAARYQAEKVFINKKQYFENVPLEVWEYYIGGYQPAEKWLKDRKGRVLSFEDIEHYQKIIAVLKTTIALQLQIDEVIGS
jgi:predicted helicase